MGKWFLNHKEKHVNIPRVAHFIENVQNATFQIQTFWFWISNILSMGTMISNYLCTSVKVKKEEIWLQLPLDINFKI